MASNRRSLRTLTAVGGISLLITIGPALAQDTAPNPATTAASGDEVKSLAEMVRHLQSQVEGLNARVKSLEGSESSLRAESQSLREQLRKFTKGASEGPIPQREYSASAPELNEQGIADAPAPEPAAQQASSDDRFAQLRDDLDLVNARLKEQSQTKVESSSKYRVRLNGLALFNLFTNRGTVDDLDVPQIATRARTLDSAGTFGGSLRQSQIALEAYGPDVGGARTGAEIRFDFAGGFPHGPNGNLMGLVRLRTGTVRFDWTNTSIVAGQDYLFFSPLAPTSFATLAIPALSYSGNLWGWTPQVRVEHRFQVSESSNISVQGGILQVLSGDYSDASYARTATWGEKSGQPAYAGRLAWSHAAFGQNVVAGLGGYYGRQGWGFGRTVDGWAGTADLTVPMGPFVEFTGQFYRGRAVGGLGGAIGQNVLWDGLLSDPATEVYGLNSMGGWVQLKLKPTVKFEINGAVGDDSPFASDLRAFSSNPIYAGTLLSKNLTSFVNFIYRPRSDMIFSLEYRHLKTFTLDSDARSANHLNLSVGYIF